MSRRGKQFAPCQGIQKEGYAPTNNNTLLETNTDCWLSGAA